MDWLWLPVLLVVVAAEVAALLNRRDRFRPATYWIRKLPWVTRAAGIAWLAWHFLVAS